MKKLSLLIALLAISIHCSYSNKYAIITGIANYPEYTGWRTIHSDNDVALLINTIGKDFKITPLTDSRATYTNIIKELLSVVNKISKGDTVIIHFSCHGQQMLSQDTQGEPDGLDECLIPYDACKTKSAKYTGQYHLNDNTLSAHIRKIMQKAGPDGLVIILLDACHSDSMNRGDDSIHIRGIKEVFGLDNPKLTDEIRKKYLKTDNEPIHKSDNEANVIYISACQSYQDNHETMQEGNWYGSLSWSFCNAYKKHGISNITEFLSELQTQMRQISQFGQKMSIRSTIGINPQPATTTKPNNHTNGTSRGDNAEEANNNWIWFWVAIIVIILILTTTKWRRK